MYKIAKMETIDKVIEARFSKQAGGGEFLTSLGKGFGDVAKAATYIIMGLTAAAGAGVGYLWDKATEPTDTDIGNAQKSYAIANLQANIDSQRKKLMEERRSIPTNHKSMRVI